jgi:hypothetical protein
MVTIDPNLTANASIDKSGIRTGELRNLSARKKGLNELDQNVTKDHPAEPKQRVGAGKTVVTVLQFLVGALVTMGGSLFALLAVNNFGKSLGLIHLSIGLAGLVGGFVALKERSWSKIFLLGINVMTIGYSSLSESIVEIESLLPSNSALGSLIGTIIAILMSATIIYVLMMKRNLQHWIRTKT